MYDTSLFWVYRSLSLIFLFSRVCVELAVSSRQLFCLLRTIASGDRRLVCMLCSGYRLQRQDLLPTVQCLVVLLSSA